MQKRTAFTLVELLVVITIITILAGLLLPALSKARKQAYLVNCTSNQKQILLAITSYVNDNAGILPKGYGADFGWIRWWHVIGRVPEYTSGNANLQAAVRGGYLRWNMTRYSGTVWTCPEAARQIADLGNHLGGKAAHYSMLDSAMGKRYAKGNARTLLLADGHLWHGASFYFGHGFRRSPLTPDPGYIPWPYQTLYSIWDPSQGSFNFDGHMQRAVFVFFDGHAASKPRFFVTDTEYSEHWSFP